MWLVATFPALFMLTLGTALSRFLGGLSGQKHPGHINDRFPFIHRERFGGARYFYWSFSGLGKWGVCRSWLCLRSNKKGTT